MQERLQKIIAASGVTSRRAAEKLITMGRVRVNGKVITRLGTRADVQKDEIEVDGKLIYTDIPKIYLMLNKPRGYITSLRDPEGRPTVISLLYDITERVFPVGRLDYDSEGLLLLTNDGIFAQKLQHPGFSVPKTYMVKVKGNLTKGEICAIRSGIEIGHVKFVPNNIELGKVNRKSCWFKLTICEGRNRIIRRVFESIDHPVIRLIRVAVLNVHLGSLSVGEYRHLEKGEIKRLLSLSGRFGTC